MGARAWGAFAAGAVLVGVATALWPAALGVHAAPVLSALLLAGLPAVLGNVVPALVMAHAPASVHEQASQWATTLAKSWAPRAVTGGLFVSCVASGPWAAGAGVFGVAAGIAVLHAQSIVCRALGRVDVEDPEAPYTRRGTWSAFYLTCPFTLGLAMSCLPLVAPAANFSAPALQLSRAASIAVMALFGIGWAAMGQPLPVMEPALAAPANEGPAEKATAETVPAMEPATV